MIERFKRRMILPECNSKGILVLAVLFGMELQISMESSNYGF